jgi:hypothetical protein
MTLEKGMDHACLESILTAYMNWMLVLRPRMTELICCYSPNSHGATGPFVCNNEDHGMQTRTEHEDMHEVPTWRGRESHITTLGCRSCSDYPFHLVLP